MKLRFEKVLPSQGGSFAVYEECARAVRCEYHVHPEFELTWVRSGFGSRLVNDDLSPFDVGELDLLGSMVPHHYWNTPPDDAPNDWSRLAVIQFRRDFGGEAIWNLTEFQAVHRMLEESAFGLTFCVLPGSGLENALLRLLASAPDALRVVTLLEVLALLAAAPSRPLSLHRLPEPEPGTGERINRALQAIHRRVEQGRSPALREVAKVAGLGEEAFSRYFVRTTGKNFVRYVTELKIGKAVSLLLHTDRPISEIAMAAGFGNLANFNRHFRRLKQRTPGEFRRLFRSMTPEV